MDTLLQPNLFDLLLLLAMGSAIWGACGRGIGIEFFHTVVFAVLLGAGLVVFHLPTGVQTPEVALQILTKMAYFVVTAYLLTWGIMRSFGHIFTGHIHPHLTFRTRFWAGALSLAKLGGVLIAMALWFVLHNPLPSPARLDPLPKLVKESATVEVLDLHVDTWANALVDNGVVNQPVSSTTPEPAPKAAEAPKARALSQQDAESLESLLAKDPSATGH